MLFPPLPLPPSLLLVLVSRNDHIDQTYIEVATTSLDIILGILI
jgi:hypothetical protein